MVRSNPSNPYTRDPGHTQKDVPMPVQKAKVMASPDHPDEDGFHSIRIRVYGDGATYIAPVLAPMFGSVWIPKEGQDVAVIFGNSNKPWVIGTWYPLDRVEDENVDLPDYTAGDIRLGNETGSHVTMNADGSIRMSTGGQQPIDIDHQSASVRMSSDQTIPGDDQYYVVNFDTVDDDPENLFDASTNSLVVQHAGQHRIESTIEIETAGQNNTYAIGLFADGQLVKRKFNQSTLGEPMSVSISTTRRVEDDDTSFDIRLRQDSGSDKIINSSDVATEFSIERHGI